MNYGALQAGAAGIIQLIDPNPATNRARFYRVQAH
jgi:hypothetical protein